MNKDEAIEALSKPLKDISDNELKGLLTIPETFFPTNPREYTTKGLLEEQVRRINAKKLTYAEVLEDVVFLTILQHLAAMGPRIHKSLDLLGIDSVTEEIRRLEPIVIKKIKQYKAENGLN